MIKKIFVDGDNPQERAYFGWQTHEMALWGIKEGYKNAADELVEIAINKGIQGDIKTLDTYIFPILFMYRHSIEISLKLIYYRCYHKPAKGSHDLLALWTSIKEVISEITSDDFVEKVKQYKEKFIKYSLEGINFKQIEEYIKELNKKDQKADVWRYLIDMKYNLYFEEGKFVDYNNLKDALNELYGVMDFFYFIVGEYLSS